MPDAERTEESVLTGAFAVIRRRIGLILLCFILVAGAALGYSLVQQKKYTATASLLFPQGEQSPGVFTDPAREAATNLELVNLKTVGERTAKEIGGLTGEQVSSKVNAEAQPTSNVVDVTATDTRPAIAAKLANTFARQFISFRRVSERRRNQRTLERLRQKLNGLSPVRRAGSQGELLRQQVGVLEAQTAQPAAAELVQRADAPTSPSSPQTAFNTALGAVLGLALGLGIAFLVERLDRRLKTPEELEDAMGVPILGQVPESLLLALHGNALQDPTSAEAEAFRTIRANLRYFNAGHGDVRTVLVTSISPEDGKSTVALSLASAAAGAGARTLLIEADLRNPSLARRVGFNANGGLSSVLIGDGTLYDMRQHVPLVHRAGDGHVPGVGVDVLLAGLIPPNPGGLIESTRMDYLLAEAERDYDLTIIDTPPIPLVSDAIPLIDRVQGVIVVGRLGNTDRDQARKLAEQLRKLEAPVLGVIANFAPPPDPEYYQYLYGHELSRSELR